MPIDRLVLILVCALAAAGITIWLSTMVAASIQFPVLGVAIIPVLLVLYIVWRVIQDRLNNAEDDHYDSIDK